MKHRLAIVVGSTRPGRVGPIFAEWLETAARALRLDLEQATRDLLAQADGETAGALTEIILAHSEQQNIADRLWVAKTGFDPDPAGLLSLETYLYD